MQNLESISTCSKNVNTLKSKRIIQLGRKSGMEKKEVGRNDPCPCGSGKKYKKCCMNKNQKFPFLPLESFKVPYSETLEPPDPKFKSKDGVLFLDGKYMMPQLQLVTVLTDLAKSEIDELHNIAPRNDLIAQYGLNICIHKLYAVRYHSENFAREEQTQIQKFEKECKPHVAVQEQLMTAKLVYELEGFLFQVKSSLDVLATGPLNTLLKLNLKTYATDKVIESLEKAKGKTSIQNVNKLKAIIEKNKRWIEELNAMRIQITHISDLKNFCCFIVMPVSGEELCTIYYPAMPDGTRATKYMESTWEKLFPMYKSILTLLNSEAAH